MNNERQTIINLLREEKGIAQIYVKWLQETPNWREEIRGPHFSSYQGQGPEELRPFFRRVRNHLTTDVEVWPTAEEMLHPFWIAAEGVE